MLPYFLERHRLNFHRTCVLLVAIKMSTAKARRKTPEEWYYQRVAWKASKDEPEECIVYAVLVEFLLRHKHPPYRFILYPQMSLKWHPNRPQDARQEITDLGLVIFTQDGYRLRCGVEAKRATLVMDQLPDAHLIINNPQVQAAFDVALIQAMDQAKAAFKNNYCFNHGQPVYWMVVVGPYWTPVQFGPFSDSDLTIRGHKTSPSEDFTARVEFESWREQGPFKLSELYCFNSQASYDRIEAILSETDAAAQPFLNQMMNLKDH